MPDRCNASGEAILLIISRPKTVCWSFSAKRFFIYSNPSRFFRQPNGKTLFKVPSAGKEYFTKLKLDLFRIKLHDESTEVVTEGHKEGELWGLATSPHKNIALSTSDDCFLQKWDLENHQKLDSLFLGEPGMV